MYSGQLVLITSLVFLRIRASAIYIDFFLYISTCSFFLFFFISECVRMIVLWNNFCLKKRVIDRILLDTPTVEVDTIHKAHDTSL